MLLCVGECSAPDARERSPSSGESGSPVRRPCIVSGSARSPHTMLPEQGHRVWLSHALMDVVEDQVGAWLGRAAAISVAELEQGTGNAPNERTSWTKQPEIMPPSNTPSTRTLAPAAAVLWLASAGPHAAAGRLDRAQRERALQTDTGTAHYGRPASLADSFRRSLRWMHLLPSRLHVR